LADRLVLSAATLLLSCAGALACQTRDVAEGIASFDDCGTPWAFMRVEDSGDLYRCTEAECGEATVLRVSRSDMSEADRALAPDVLVKDWTARQIPQMLDGNRFEMLGPIAAATLGGRQGILIRLRITDADDDNFISHAFRLPLKGHYLILNATGDVEETVLDRVLRQAAARVVIREPRQ
jgi:hypothetical protein